MKLLIDSDIVFTMLGYPKDVKDVILGSEKAKGVLQGLKESEKSQFPKVVVDMTTSEPSLAVEIQEEAKMLQVETLDAPVSGGDVGARNATLSVLPNCKIIK